MMTGKCMDKVWLGSKMHLCNVCLRSEAVQYNFDEDAKEISAVLISRDTALSRNETFGAKTRVNSLFWTSDPFVLVTDL